MSILNSIITDTITNPTSKLLKVLFIESSHEADELIKFFWNNFDMKTTTDISNAITIGDSHTRDWTGKTDLDHICDEIMKLYKSDVVDVNTLMNSPLDISDTTATIAKWTNTPEIEADYLRSHENVFYYHENVEKMYKLMDKKDGGCEAWCKGITDSVFNRCDCKKHAILKKEMSLIDDEWTTLNKSLKREQSLYRKEHNIWSDIKLVESSKKIDHIGMQLQRCNKKLRSVARKIKAIDFELY